ncbi:MAG: phenylacetate-coenzyme A ligase [Dehalococcoidia bacterium]|nr:MAG: phenylacetate-coenzyme A ligase [Dehalococcoidia bacterium]
MADHPLTIPEVPIPYFFRALDWEQLVHDYPPAPRFFRTTYLTSSEAIRALQESRLPRALAHAYSVPFYRKRWDAVGVHPRDIRTLEDLRLLPTYRVDDIRRSVEEHPPFGDYQGVTPDDVQRGPLRLFTSGGTTGRPRPMFYSPWDRQVGAILRARAFYLAGFRPGDLVQNTLLYSLHNGAFIVDEALYHWCGCIPVTTSAGLVTRSRRQVEILREWGVRGLVGFHDFLMHLAETARELGYDPAKDFSLRAIASMGGQPRELERVWGCNVAENYGMHEVQVVAAECPAKAGMHLWLDAFVVEVVDLETGAPLPDGAVGSLVLTALYKTGAPVVRYDTRDTARILSRDRCACGSWLPRISSILGRADTMVKLRGINVWPEAVGEIVRRDPRVGGEYFCYVERREGRDEMVVLVERKAEVEESATLQRDLAEQLRTQLGVTILVEVCPPGGTQPFTRFGSESKPRRFEDRRHTRPE